MERYDTMTETLLERPCWVIDFLPKRVPADSPGRYFSVEAYYREPERRRRLHGRFFDLLLKLNCYRDLSVWDAERAVWEKNPPPDVLEALLLRDGAFYLSVLFGEGEALFTIDGEDLYMSVYGPSEELLSCVRTLAKAEGLFVRRSEE